MTDPSTLLAPWQATDPPERLIIVGAGWGAGDWVQAARRWAVPDVWLIEADPAAAAALERLATDWAGCRVVNAVLADTEGEHAFHTASLASESGLLHPSTLTGHFPHLACRATDSRDCTTLDALLEGEPEAASWLVVDCVASDRVLNGARTALHQIDLVVMRRYAARAVDAPNGVSDGNEVWSHALELNGLTRRAVGEALHPGIDLCVHVRDHRLNAQTLSLALAESRAEVQLSASRLVQAETDHLKVAEQYQFDLEAARTNEAQRSAQLTNQLTDLERLLTSADAQTLAAVTTAAVERESHAATQVRLEQLTLALASAESAVVELEREHALAIEANEVRQREYHAQSQAHQKLAGENAARLKALEAELATAQKADADLQRKYRERDVQLVSASVELTTRPRPLRLETAVSADAAPTRPEFFGFWDGGQLSPFEWLCLKSFVDYGYSVTLYSYATALEVPAHVVLGDAREILDEILLGRIRYESGSIYASFSDYFRYAGIRKTGKVWIDTDVLCLSPHIKSKQGYILCGEIESLVSTGVIGLPQQSPCLDALLERCEASIDQTGMIWGSLGPKLLTPMLARDPQHQILERFHFYPVYWRHAAKLFVPADREHVLHESCGSWGIHLWNEVITRSGYHKRLCPPVGSYLHDKVVEHGVLDRFVEILPEETMVKHAARFQ